MDEALTKADEAQKKAKTDADAAAKVVTDAAGVMTKAGETKKVADDAFAKSDEAQKKAKADQDNAAKAATDAAAAAKAASDKLAAAKEALAKDTENQALKDAAAAAEKEAADAGARQKAADEAKVAADKVFTDADAARKTAETNKSAADMIVTVADASKKVAADVKAATDKVVADSDTARKTAETNKQAADKAATDALAVMNQASEKVKQIAPNFQKATDERTAAERTLQTAQRGVERAAESVKKATEAIPGVDAKVKAAEAIATQRDQEVQTATAAVPATEKPLKSIAFAPDGATFAVVGDDQLLHTYSAETGAPVEVYSALRCSGERSSLYDRRCSNHRCGQQLRCDLGFRHRVEAGPHDRLARHGHGANRPGDCPRFQPRWQAARGRRGRTVPERRDQDLQHRDRAARPGAQGAAQRHGQLPRLLARRPATGELRGRSVRQSVERGRRQVRAVLSKGIRTTCWASPGGPTAGCWPPAAPTWS